jgi:16S rRNA (guanine1207-N2)-methyltransferase
VERLFGNVQVLAFRGRCRVLRAVKADATDLPPSDYHTWRMVETHVGEEPLTYATKPGVFSWQRLDDGTRLMIEALQDRPLHVGDHVLDVGSGSGVLTLIAARQAREGHVVALDADCRAVEATRRTLAHNCIANAEVALSDCGQAVAGRFFDVVVTNPPFHQEKGTTYAIAEQIIREAARCLCRRGRLYVVANSFLRYRPIIEVAFGNVQILRQSNRFTVWCAVRRAK